MALKQRIRVEITNYRVSPFELKKFFNVCLVTEKSRAPLETYRDYRLSFVLYIHILTNRYSCMRSEKNSIAACSLICQRRFLLQIFNVWSILLTHTGCPGSKTITLETGYMGKKKIIIN